MGVITIILAPFAFIGIVSLARHLAFRPPRRGPAACVVDQ